MLLETSTSWFWNSGVLNPPAPKHGAPPPSLNPRPPALFQALTDHKLPETGRRLKEDVKFGYSKMLIAIDPISWWELFSTEKSSHHCRNTTIIKRSWAEVLIGSSWQRPRLVCVQIFYLLFSQEWCLHAQRWGVLDRVLPLYYCWCLLFSE